MFLLAELKLIKDTEAVLMILLSCFRISNFLLHSESKLRVTVSKASIKVTFVVGFVVMFMFINSAVDSLVDAVI